MTGFFTTFTGPRRILTLGLLITLASILTTFLLDPYRNFQLTTIAVFFTVTAGLTLLIGQSGQLSLGHAALMATGGYGYVITANALTKVGVTGFPRFIVSILLAAFVAGVLGLLFGLAAARLHGPYLAGLTLALVLAVPAVATTFPVLGGDQGLPGQYEGVPQWLSGLVTTEQWQAWVALLVAGVVVTWLAVLSNGSFGLRMRAVRDNETAARLSGVAATRVKVAAFTISAVAAGISGAILAFVTQSVSPGAYTLAFSLQLVVAVVLGGLGSIGGAAIGSALIVLLPWATQQLTTALPLSAELTQRLSGDLPVLVFGALVTITILLRPTGLAGLRTAFSRKKHVSISGPT